MAKLQNMILDVGLDAGTRPSVPRTRKRAVSTGADMYHVEARMDGHDAKCGYEEVRLRSARAGTDDEQVDSDDEQPARAV